MNVINSIIEKIGIVPTIIIASLIILFILGWKAIIALIVGIYLGKEFYPRIDSLIQKVITYFKNL